MVLSQSISHAALPGVGLGVGVAAGRGVAVGCGVSPGLSVGVGAGTGVAVATTGAATGAATAAVVGVAVGSLPHAATIATMIASPIVINDFLGFKRFNMLSIIMYLPILSLCFCPMDLVVQVVPLLHVSTLYTFYRFSKLFLSVEVKFCG